MVYRPISLDRVAKIAAVPLFVMGLAATAAEANEAVPEYRMQKYCQGEASAHFDVRPQYIETSKPEKRGNGAHSVYGHFEIDGGRTDFECRFTPSNHFNFVKKTDGGKHKAEKEEDDRPSDEASDHASGSLRCTMANAQQGGMCPFEVTREGGGSAKVTVDKPDGQSRVIFFKGGKATGYRQTQQANPERFSASKQGDTSIVTIGGERYEIPDAVVFGG